MVWEKGSEEISSFGCFTTYFWTVFDHPTGGVVGRKQLLQLTQGSHRVAYYAAMALLTAFCLGSRSDLLIEMACRDDNSSLDFLISLAFHLDNLLCERHHSRTPLQVSVQAPDPKPELMQIDVTYLSATEHTDWVLKGLCLYCCGEGHQFSACPTRPPRYERSERETLP